MINKLIVSHWICQVSFSKHFR